MINLFEKTRYYGLIFMLLMSTLVRAIDLPLKSQRITVGNGLLSNTVLSITQDKYGYIWLSTTAGLSRYDGYSFMNLSSLSTLPGKGPNGNVISSYIDDEANVIWAYTPEHTMACYDMLSASFVDYTNKGEESQSWYFRRNFPGALWLYENGRGTRRVVRDTHNKFVVTDFNQDNGKIPSNDIIDIQYDQEKDYTWILNKNALTLVDKQDNINTVSTKYKIRAMRVWNGGCLIVTEDGLVLSAEIKSGNKGTSISLKSFAGQNHGMFDSSTFVSETAIWNNQLVIFTSKGTFVFNLKTGQASMPSDIQLYRGRHSVSCHSDDFFYDKEGNVLILSRQGWSKRLHLIDDKSIINRRDYNFSFAQGLNNDIFITVYGQGLYVYNHDRDELHHYTKDDKKPLLPTDYLLTSFVDNSGCLWIGSDDGLFLVSQMKGGEMTYLIPAQEGALSEWQNYVRAIWEQDGQVFFSTRENRVYKLEKQKYQISKVAETKSCVYAYHVDNDGHTWIGTRGDGLYIDKQRYSRGDTTYGIPKNDVYSIATDGYGRTWLTNWGTGLLLASDGARTKPVKFQTFIDANYRQGRIRQLCIDNSGYLWTVTDDGLFMVDTKKRKIEKSDILCFNTQNDNFPFTQCLCVKALQDGSIAVGGIEGLVIFKYDEKSGKLDYEYFTTKEGLTTNIVRSVCEDKDNRIWIGTDEGLACLNRKNKQIKTYLFSEQIYGNIYSEGCSMLLEDGRLLFGTKDGLAVLKPRPISMDRPHRGPQTKTFGLAFTDFYIDGVSVFDDDKLKKEFVSNDKIVLPHTENSISVYFSNFQYGGIESSLYQYYMEGVNKTWGKPTSVNHADYSELPPGKYVLHLRTMTEENTWGEEKTLNIVIREPWYNTWLAWLMYILVAGTIGYYVYRLWRRNFVLKQQMQVEKQLAEFRTNFFAHVTHEFRTPLAIMQSSIDKMREDHDMSALKMLDRGQGRLQRLVNQLMEFRRAQTNSIRLMVGRNDIVKFIGNIVSDFSSTAEQKEITLNYEPFTNSFDMMFDKHVIESIVYNLVSNAMKYSNTKGHVTVKLNKADREGFLQLTVEDDGPGISKGKQQYMFKPFMQGHVSQGGIGIGLYLAKQMAEVHHGYLTYQNVTEDSGSRFIVDIPFEEDYYIDDDYTEVSDEKNTDTNLVDNNESLLVEDTSNQNDEKDSEDSGKVRIAIIEDDPDMMIQLKTAMGKSFRVDAYMNGKEGYLGVKNNPPQLIISDVMLPDMNGYDIVGQLKQEEPFKSIPAIMLTALDDEESQIKGYQVGADDYMVKPCNFKVLEVRCQQLIQWSGQQESTDEKNTEDLDIELKDVSETKETAEVEQDISNEGISESKDDSKPIDANYQDQRFRRQVEAIVERNIANPNFSIDRLAEMMHMGRTKFYGRMREVTGISPNKYLKNERMRIAAELLLDGRYNVSEVATKVGIQDSSYFYKCFRQHFGVPPSKYAKTQAPE